MDIFITGLILLILVMAVAPFFLLSSAFGASKRVKAARDDNSGPITPIPDSSGAVLGRGKRDSGDDDDMDDADGDADGGGAGI